MSETRAKICVIGFGYVGLPLAAEFGKFRPTVGFDINEAEMDELKEGHGRTRETTAGELAAAVPPSFATEVLNSVELDSRLLPITGKS